MFEQLIAKLNDLGTHHQAAFALIGVVSVVCVSWGVETIIETYIFPDKPLRAALITIAGGLFILWLTKHVILHII